MKESIHQLLHLLRYDVWRLRGWLLAWMGFFLLGTELIQSALAAWAPLPLNVFKLLTHDSVDQLIAFLRYGSALALMVVAIQFHPGIGRRQGWATLPVPRGLLTVSKLCFLLCGVVLPWVLARVLRGFLVNGAEWREIVPVVGLEVMGFGLWAALLAWIAIQSAGFPGFLARCLAILTLIGFLVLTRPYKTLIELDWTTFFNQTEVRILVTLALTAGFWAVVHLHYARRQLMLTLATGGAMTVLLIGYQWTQFTFSNNRPAYQMDLAGLPVQRVQTSGKTTLSNDTFDSVRLELDPALLETGEFLGPVDDLLHSQYENVLRHEALRAANPGAQIASGNNRRFREWDRFDLLLQSRAGKPRVVEVPVCRLEEIGRAPFGKLVRWNEDGVPRAAWNELGFVMEDRFFFDHARMDFGWSLLPWNGGEAKLVVVIRPNKKTVWFPEIDQWGQAATTTNSIKGTYAVPCPGLTPDMIRETMRGAEVVIYRAKPVRILVIDYREDE